MDSLTHFVTGVTISLAGPYQAHGLAATIAITAGAFLVDWDLIVWLRGNFAYLKYHRGFSHSAFGIMLLSLVIGGIMTPFFPEMSWWSLSLYALLGSISHLVMDLTTVYGTRVLLPFSRRWVSWDLITGFDPLVIAPLLAPHLLSGPAQMWAARLALVWIASYYVLKGLIRKRAKRRIERLLQWFPGRVVQVGVFPYMISPLNWLTIVVTEDGLWRGKLRLWSSKPPRWDRHPNGVNHEILELASRGEGAQLFFQQARIPWPRIEYHDDGATAIWEDFRYKYLRNRRSFSLTVRLDDRGRIAEESFVF